MGDILVCSKCNWKSLLGLSYGSLEWLPPCPRCESVVEGFRIIYKEQAE